MRGGAGMKLVFAGSADRSICDAASGPVAVHH